MWLWNHSDWYSLDIPTRWQPISVEEVSEWLALFSSIGLCTAQIVVRNNTNVVAPRTTNLDSPKLAITNCLRNREKPSEDRRKLCLRCLTIASVFQPEMCVDCMQLLRLIRANWDLGFESTESQPQSLLTQLWFFLQEAIIPLTMWLYDYKNIKWVGILNRFMHIIRYIVTCTLKYSRASADTLH